MSLNKSIVRRPTRRVLVGHVPVGGGAPVVVQSMTNTDTADIAGSVAQVHALWQAGSELVRLTVNTEEAARAVPVIREKLDALGCGVPLIGDFHFNGHRLIKAVPECAEALAKLRINPGNVGRGAKKDEQFATLVEAAARYGKAVRIGVNWGSLDQELLARMMDENAKRAKPHAPEEVMRNALINRIVLSCKLSGVQDLVKVYRDLAARSDYALHLGLTEAGMGSKGIVASTAALAILMQEGIGDTIRVSLTPQPGESRTTEVQVAQEILQVMGIRSFTPLVTACPGCGRTTSTVFQELAQNIQNWLRTQMPIWRGQYPGVETMNVAVMGCVVNGPGESKHANVGISLPGTGEVPVAPVYVDGAKTVTLKGERIAEDFQAIVENYVQQTYGPNKNEQS